MEFFGKWAEISARYAFRTVLYSGVFFAISMWLTVNFMQFEADHSELVKQSEPFWGPQNEVSEKFPQFFRTAVVVIDADTVDLADDASEALAARMRDEPDMFRSVFLPTEDPFFKRNAFMFLELEELGDVIDKLADAQPALAAVSQDPNLRGFFSLIDTGITALEEDTDLPPAFADLMDETASGVEDYSSGKPVSLSWADSMMGENKMALRRIITVKPVVTGRKPQAEERAMVAYIREIAREPYFSADNGVSVRVTGRLGMEYDELQAIKKGVGLAGVLSLVFLAIILSAGLPSWRLIVSVYVTLFAGLQWTMGFATLAVGSLNMMSAAFAVLFIGLGVDHALHIALRYNENLVAGQKHFDAIRSAANTTGSAVALCALTSAIGFAAFIPTDYKGIAQLGLIAAAGMGFAVIASMTLMPAMFTLLGAGKRTMGEPRLKPGEAILKPRRRFAILGVTFGLVAIYFVTETGLLFNFSSMSIRDPNSESVSTLFDLQEDDVETNFVATILAADKAEALDLAARLEALPQVREANTPYDYVPEDQDEKLLMIEDATIFLWPALRVNENPDTLDEAERLAVVDEFIARTAKLQTTDTETLAALQRLAAAFSKIRNDPNGGDLAGLETELLYGVLRQLTRLRLALEADYIDFETLPVDLRHRLIAPDGTHKVTAIPDFDITEVGPLTSFVEAVQSVSPRVTGRPIVESGVGAIVVRSFIQAGIVALVFITGLLLYFFRNLRETLLVLVPILLAGILLVATMNVLGLTFNYGNVIALPLIFGLGVDSSIHLVLRARETHSAAQVVSSSTPQAVLLSSLTTVAAFASLSFSPHWGIASIGIALTIGIVWLLVCTLLVLPGLIRLGAKD